MLSATHIAIAQALAKTQPTPKHPKHERQRRVQWLTDMWALSDELAARTRNFDRERFCGIARGACK